MGKRSAIFGRRPRIGVRAAMPAVCKAQDTCSLGAHDRSGARARERLGGEGEAARLHCLEGA
eukprot:7128523-Alexandrium_andersonii.AAC.1